MTTLPIRLNFTRYFLGIIPACLFIVVSCDQKEKTKPHNLQVSARETPPIQIEELILNQEAYLNKRVHVSGYLFTHEEGPWLAGTSKPEFPKNSMILSLSVTVDFQLNDQEGSKIRWFEYDPKGKAVEITGIFSVRNEKLPLGHEFRKRPLITVDSVMPGSREK